MGWLLVRLGERAEIMEAPSREFLSAEYDAVWRYVQYIDSVRNKAVALYLAVLGATAGVLLQGASLDARVGLYTLLHDKLSPVLLFSVLIFGLIASAFVVRLSIKFRSLFIEYTYSLNRIRRRFEKEDPGLTPFLVLPTRMPNVRPGTHGSTRDVHFFLSGVSALIAWLFIVSGLYRAGLSDCAPWIATIASIGVLGVSWWWYVRDVQTTLDNLWDRCPGAVADEIDAKAKEIESTRKNAEQSRAEAEQCIKERWGQLRRRRCGRSCQ